MMVIEAIEVIGGMGGRGERGERGRRPNCYSPFSSGGSVEAISLTAFSRGMSARDVSMYSSS